VIGKTAIRAAFINKSLNEVIALNAKRAAVYMEFSALLRRLVVEAGAGKTDQLAMSGDFTP
jgi:hypothetical protein